MDFDNWVMTYGPKYPQTQQDRSEPAPVQNFSFSGNFTSFAVMVASKDKKTLPVSLPILYAYDFSILVLSILNSSYYRCFSHEEMSGFF